MFQLRPYQAEAKEAILKAWDEGHQKTLLVLPTGCGKTIVFASVTEEEIRKGRRVLILAHRGELLSQAADKLKTAYGIDSILEKAESSSVDSDLPVTIGSVQTLTRENRLAQFDEQYFDTIIVDEAHHCLSDSYKRILDHFPKANVLGVTATPDRGDMQDLSEYFNCKAYEYSMSRAIREKHLCPIKAQLIPLKLDISEVGISNGDFAVGQIGSALEPYLEQIACEMLKYCVGRKTVVFLPLINISQKFCGILNGYGFRAAEVNGTSTDREEILSDFESGKYEVLCNSMLLTEGWDCPAVDCIIVLRPTKIRSLYQQMVGRGMRLSPGKDHLLLLDFLWMTERHDLCKASSLVSKNQKIAETIDADLEGGELIDLLEAEEAAEQKELEERESSLAKVLKNMRTRKGKCVDPIQYALSIAAEDLADYEPTFAWEKAPPTEKQLAFLESRGISTGAVTCAGLASVLIDRLIRRQDEGLSSPKQIRCLERFGFREVGTWTSQSASKMIGRLEKNHWCVPYGIDPGKYKPKEIDIYV